MNAEEKLKPCPFCGGKPRIRKIGNDYTKTRKVEIKCPNCRCTRTDAAIRNNHEWVLERAIENWNNQITQPKQLSDEEAITAMFNRSKELEIDLYKEEVEELYNVVRARTGGGVDEDELRQVIGDAMPKDTVTDAREVYYAVMNYLTQRNQQEKG